MRVLYCISRSCAEDRWSEWVGLYSVSVLVVEHDIREPDVVGGDS